MTEAVIEGEKLRQQLEMARVVQMSSLPRTMPGTPTATPCSVGFGTPTNIAGGAPAGAFSRVSIANVRLCSARWIVMKPPPPMPADGGSTTLSA